MSKKRTLEEALNTEYSLAEIIKEYEYIEESARWKDHYDLKRSTIYREDSGYER